MIPEVRMPTEQPAISAINAGQRTGETSDIVGTCAKFVSNPNMRRMTKNSTIITTVTAGKITQLRQATASNDSLTPVTTDSHAAKAAQRIASIPHTSVWGSVFIFSTALIIPYKFESFIANDIAVRTTAAIKGTPPKE